MGKKKAFSIEEIQKKVDFEGCDWKMAQIILASEKGWITPLENPKPGTLIVSKKNKPSDESWSGFITKVTEKTIFVRFMNGSLSRLPWIPPENWDVIGN